MTDRIFNLRDDRLGLRRGQRVDSALGCQRRLPGLAPGLGERNKPCDSVPMNKAPSSANAGDSARLSTLTSSAGSIMSCQSRPPFRLL